MTVKSKVVLITGAGSGIGRATALALARNGARLVLCGRRQPPLEQTAKDCDAAGGESLAVVADVGDAGAVRNLFASTLARFGRLDVLFNNAGGGIRPTPMEDVSLEQWSRVVASNLTGAFLCTQEAIKAMKAQEPRGGRIINNGSISAHAPRPLSAPYTITKHAVTGLTRSTALEGRRYDIACGQIDIGNAQSDMTTRMQQGVLQPNGEMMPEPVMDVAHVAEAVVYMASLPLDANVLFTTVMATKMPFVGRG